jgi:hypothetical protein
VRSFLEPVPVGCRLPEHLVRAVSSHGALGQEHAAIAEIAESMGARSTVCTHFMHGGRGATELAEAVEEASDFRFIYPEPASWREKIEAVATQVYGAEGVDYDLTAARQLATYERRVRAHAGVHRQDPPVALLGRFVDGRSDRVAAARAGGARLGLAPGSSTRSAATCGPCPASARTRPRTLSTSTRTAISSTSREPLRTAVLRRRRAVGSRPHACSRFGAMPILRINMRILGAVH